jgi:cysteinyl-tRNA synthetase
MKWDPKKFGAPWGVGYPGWHIECSAMAQQVLGRLAGHRLDTIDIHTGGEDNIFPHHECEIAQSCGASGQALFARFWLHTRFLLVEGQKMSKSRGNFYTVRDVLEGKATQRPVDPAVLRYELIKSHYRSNMNFTVKGLEDSASAVRRIRELRGRLVHDAGPAAGTIKPVPGSHPVVGEFSAALSDDLNMSGALAVLFTWMGQPMPDPVEALGVLEAVDSVLGISGSVQVSVDSAPGADDQAAAACRQIDAARRAKDFATADRLRQELQNAGYDVMTTKAGTAARKRLA